MSAPYNHESLAHALAHHSSRGVLGAVTTTPSRGRPWRVAFPVGSTTVEALELSNTEAYALCVALAASEHHERANHERFVRELSERDGPICLDDALDRFDRLRAGHNEPEPVLLDVHFGAVSVVTDGSGGPGTTIEPVPQRARTEPGQWCEPDECPAGICGGPHVTHECNDGDRVTMRFDAGPCPLCGAS